MSDRELLQQDIGSQCSISASKHEAVLLAGYEITKDGRVFSNTNWRGMGRRELVQQKNHDGYPSVRVTLGKKRVHYSVHTLVALVHISPRPSVNHEVRHLDGNKMNSSVDNLAWGTQKENADDRERHGRTSRGHTHSTAIRASNQADGTRAYRRAQKELAHA